MTEPQENASELDRRFRLYRWLTLLAGSAVAVVIIVTSLVVSLTSGEGSKRSLVLGASISSALLVVAVCAALITIWMRRRRILSRAHHEFQSQQEEILQQIQQRRWQELQVDIRNQTQPSAPPPSDRYSSATTHAPSEFRTASFWHQHHAAASANRRN